MDCRYCSTEDITPYHGDVFGHPEYKHTCMKCGKEIIPYLHCNKERCVDYIPKNYHYDKSTILSEILKGNKVVVVDEGEEYKTLCDFSGVEYMKDEQEKKGRKPDDRQTKGKTNGMSGN